MLIRKYIKTKFLFLISLSFAVIYLLTISRIKHFGLGFINFSSTTITFCYVGVVLIVLYDCFKETNTQRVLNTKTIVTMIIGVGFFLSHVGSDYLDPLSGEFNLYLFEILLLLLLVASITLEAYFNNVYDNYKYSVLLIKVILGIAFTITFVLFIFQIYENYLYGRLFE